MGFNHTIRCGIGHTGEHEACFDLVVIQETLIGLINFTGDEFAGAGGASTGTAGIREVNASLFSRVKDVFGILDLDGFVEALGET